MPLVESVLAPLRDPQLAAKLAAHATGPAPAWLWSTDGSRIIWANAVGAAIFGAADAGECQERRFGAKDATAAQIVRLAATLPTSGQPRLERLRGFGADFGRALTCVCSRLILADGTPVVLIIATEPAGPPLPLRERVRRLLADRRRALAAFALEGTLLYATEPALTRFVGTATLSTLGVDAVAAPALVNGSASGATPYGPVTVERLGSDASTVLVLMFAARAGEIPAEQIPAEAGAPVPSPAPAPSDAEAPSSPLPAPEAPAAAPAPLHVEAPPSSPSVQEVPATAPASLPVEAPLSPQAHAGEASAVAAPSEALTNSAAPAEANAGTIQPVLPPAQAPAIDIAASERRHPLRFVWQMDADGRFAIGSDEFIELMGPRTTSAFGRLWSEIAAELNLDPDNQVARAVATHETWSSITLSWPVDESRERLAVELSGLPVFDRNRNFRGYRGFGVLRDIARTNQLARARRERPMGFGAQPEAPTERNGASASPALPIAPPADTPPADTPLAHAQLADTQSAALAPAFAAAPEPPSPSIAAAVLSPAPAEIAPRPERPAADAAAANVVPFRSGAPTDAKAPSSQSGRAQGVPRAGAGTERALAR